MHQHRHPPPSFFLVNSFCTAHTHIQYQNENTKYPKKKNEHEFTFFCSHPIWWSQHWTNERTNKKKYTGKLENVNDYRGSKGKNEIKRKWLIFFSFLFLVDCTAITSTERINKQITKKKTVLKKRSVAVKSKQMHACVCGLQIKKKDFTITWHN